MASLRGDLSPHIAVHALIVEYKKRPLIGYDRRPFFVLEPRKALVFARNVSDWGFAVGG